MINDYGMLVLHQGGISSDRTSATQRDLRHSPASDESTPCCLVECPHSFSSSKGERRQSALPAQQGTLAIARTQAQPAPSDCIDQSPPAHASGHLSERAGGSSQHHPS